MSYKNIVKQTEIPYFVELYEFEVQGQSINLTNHVDKIIKGREYLPAIIERKDITQDTSGNTQTEILLYAGSSAIKHFIATEVSTIFTTIKMFFIEQDVVRTIFSGWGEQIAITSDFYVILKVTDFLSFSRVQIPNLIYSAYCNNSFGDERCKYNPNLLAIFPTVTETDNGKSLTSSVFSQYPAGYFTYGQVDYIHEGITFSRLIIDHKPNEAKIYLQVPMPVSVNGKQVKVTPGCDKSPKTCKEKFNNIQNFIGFPYIPVKNPSIWGI